MPLPASPIVRRQRLGAELKVLRKAQRMTGEDVVARLGWASNSKVSRLENGQSRPNLNDILDLLDLYGVSGAKREELIAIARDASSTGGWWRSFSDMGARQRGYIELESGAAEIREYQQFLVPGLLQTTDYTRVRVTSGRDVQGNLDIDADVHARHARQALLASEGAPRYEVVLEEGALHRNVAPAPVMRAQMRQLLVLLERPSISIRLLPLGASVADYYVPHSSFSLYRFHDPADPETVVLETLTSDVHLRDEEDVALYKLVFGWLRDSALSPEESEERIATLASQA